MFFFMGTERSLEKLLGKAYFPGVKEYPVFFQFIEHGIIQATSFWAAQGLLAIIVQAEDYLCYTYEVVVNTTF